MPPKLPGPTPPPKRARPESRPEPPALRAPDTTCRLWPDGRIQFGVRLAAVALAIGVTTSLAFSGTPGEFRGVVGEVADRGPNWIYVEGRNGTIRVVEVSSAKVTYGTAVPASKRRKVAANGLTRGAEVRVTGELEDGGDWHASEIEIIRPAADNALKH
jgi:hypothetical protein